MFFIVHLCRKLVILIAVKVTYRKLSNYSNMAEEMVLLLDSVGVIKSHTNLGFKVLVEVVSWWIYLKSFIYFKANVKLFNNLFIFQLNE